MKLPPFILIATEILLPYHRIVRDVVQSFTDIGVEIISAKKASSKKLSIVGESSAVVEEKWLVHALALCKTGEARFWWEGADLLAIGGAKAGLGVEVAILEHHHPIMPWIRCVLDLAFGTEIQLFLDGEEIHVLSGLISSHFVVLLAHKVNHFLIYFSATICDNISR